MGTRGHKLQKNGDPIFFVKNTGTWGQSKILSEVATFSSGNTGTRGHRPFTLENVTKIFEFSKIF